MKNIRELPNSISNVRRRFLWVEPVTSFIPAEFIIDTRLDVLSPRGITFGSENKLFHMYSNKVPNEDFSHRSYHSLEVKGYIII